LWAKPFGSPGPLPSQKHDVAAERSHQNALFANPVGARGPTPPTSQTRGETTRTPCRRSRPRGPGGWGRGYAGWGREPSIPEVRPPEDATRGRNHQNALWAKAHIGGLGVVPQKIQTWGRDQRSLTVVRGCPSPGGRARGTARSRPWGGRPDPSLKRLIPNTTRHEAAQVNYNINELIMNRCSAGLFTASRYLLGPRRSRASGVPARGQVGPHQDPTAALLARADALPVVNCM
jgi:hypothetical protein